MTKELEEKLLNKYSKLFAQHKLPMTQTCMCWGIETGDGWYEIIDTACEELQALSDLMGTQIELTQVKEKFGTLQIYTNMGDDNVHEICATAETTSSHTCESCGKPGELRDHGYMFTMCRWCWVKHRIKIALHNFWFSIKNIPARLLRR